MAFLDGHRNIAGLVAALFERAGGMPGFGLRGSEWETGCHFEYDSLDDRYVSRTPGG